MDAAQLDFAQKVNETLVETLHEVEDLTGIFIVKLKPLPEGLAVGTSCHFSNKLTEEMLDCFASAVLRDLQKILEAIEHG